MEEYSNFSTQQRILPHSIYIAAYCERFATRMVYGISLLLHITLLWMGWLRGLYKLLNMDFKNNQVVPWRPKLLISYYNIKWHHTPLLVYISLAELFYYSILVISSEQDWMRSDLTWSARWRVNSWNRRRTMIESLVSKYKFLS